MQNNRFGEYLVNHDIIRIGQLVEALQLQVEYDINENRHVLLGEILVYDMGLLGEEEMEKYLRDWEEEFDRANSQS